MTRNPKIARLPRLLRDELNHRLAHNEDDATLLDWLNAAPNVKDLLARDFAGEPVSRQNLHEWRHGGFVEWQSRQHLFAAASDLTDANGEWDALTANDFTERLAAVLVVRYADALAAWNGGDDEAFRLKLRDLRRFNQDLAVLRRYNQSAARLKMDQMSFYQTETQRAEAAESSRKPSAAGARADEERVAPRQREAAAGQKIAPAGVQPVATTRCDSQNEGPVKAGKTNCLEFRASIDRSPATASPKNEVAPVAAAPESAAAQPVAGRGNAEMCATDKSTRTGAAILAVGLIKANLVIKFVDLLRQASKVIEAKSSHAMNLKDRRAVREAYACGMATLNRLGKETGFLRTQLPAFAEVGRVGAAIALLQREYPRLKPNLFSGLSSAVAAGIQQLCDAAVELGETLRQKSATGASLAA